VGRVGSERTETFLRSAAKPFQAMPLLVAGGVDRLGLSAEDVALICASHNGTQAHVERVEDLLRRGGFASRDLQCGVHAPFDEATATRLAREGTGPSALHNNCSGKHAGMLLTCRLRGWPTDTYLEVDHPLHRAVLGELSAVCGVAPDAVGIGIDGCSAPCFSIELAAAARGFARLAEPTGGALSDERVEALRIIADSMAVRPEMVAGPGTFTTRLMEETGGRILGKEGAQGVYAVAVRGPVPLGLVVKIADGWDRARSTVVLDLLRQLGSLGEDEASALSSFHEPAIYNRRGLEVGRVVSSVEIERLEEPVEESA
jgi:L-asparaginase II